MAKTLVLHIGDPKTGTSAIQHILYNRHWACPSVTLDYPPVLNASALAASLREGRLNDGARELFDRYAFWLEQSTADVAVISAEQFAALEPALVHEAFATFFPAAMDRLQVVAYARPHVERFVSAYAQRVKVGSLNAEMADFYDRPGISRLLGMHDRFMAWRRAFGPALIVRPMQTARMLRGDVVADFLGVALRTEDFQITANTRFNVSLPLEALSGLRTVQGILRKSAISVARRQAVGDRISTLVAMEPGLRGRKIQPDPGLLGRLVRDCRQDAEAMDADFLGGPILGGALAAAKGAAETVSTRAGVHFRPARLARLRRLAHGLADELADPQDAWIRAHRRDKGNKPHLRENAALSEGAPEAIARMEAILAEVAVILAKP